MVKGAKAYKHTNGARVVRCERKATMYVAAFGGKSWCGYFCRRHVTRIIEKRMPLIIKYKQNVVLRKMTAFDRKRVKGKR
jgi:hypothetical protein